MSNVFLPSRTAIETDDVYTRPRYLARIRRHTVAPLRRRTTYPCGRCRDYELHSCASLAAVLLFRGHGRKIHGLGDQVPCDRCSWSCVELGFAQPPDTLESRAMYHECS
jgi:hypothetical protein